MRNEIGFFLILIGVVGCCALGESNFSLTCYTSEYKEGYAWGYTEHNDTKYQAACIICDDVAIMYTGEQSRYAKGYYDGYEAYNSNETARILGV